MASLTFYEPFLATEQWPSESRGGKGRDWMLDVHDMTPQHAVGALHKLVRVATEYAADEFEEEQARRSIRQTPLARALAAQALGLRDFAPDEDASLQPFVRLSDIEMARALAHGLLDSPALSPMQAAELATALTHHLTQAQGLTLVKETV